MARLPRRQARFMIGLFVTVGLLIGVAAIVWLGASSYFRKGALYVTYFDESVQGLQVDSSVKYRGVEVGNVQRIGVAPDNQLVEVVIKIALEGDVEHTTVAQLRAAGITGIVFVELDRRRHPDEPVFLPPTPMHTQYPIIPSKPSQTKQVLTTIEEIMDLVTQTDIKGVTDQVKGTLLAIQTFVADPEMKKVVRNLDSAAEDLDKNLRNIERITAGGKIEGILAAIEQGIGETRQRIGDAKEGIANATLAVGEAREGIGEIRQGIGEARQGLGDVKQVIAETRQGVADIRKLVAAVENEVGGLKTAEISGEGRRLIEALDRRTKVMATDLRETTANIRDAAEELQVLIERLKETPSDLLFSDPVRDARERGER
jgi:phospholipid/cholesterol/gamma-HCH transport system substrate-binding protein